MEHDELMFSEADLRHVMRMVFLDNKGCTVTEALMLGFEESIVMYLKSITKSDVIPVLEDDHGA